MLKSGISFAVEREILGHAGIRRTQTCAKVCDEMVRSEMMKLRFASEQEMQKESANWLETLNGKTDS